MAHYNQGRSNATPHYVYEELSSSTSIRILKIQPSSESTDTVICELDEEVFQPGKTSALKYEALSYCWGTAPERKEIKIKKKQMHYPFQVSPNLESALRALRKSVEERFLWIDAICINQNNIDERNQQVTKMDLIYGNAENVCIWLGPGDDRSKLAMDFIKNNVLRLWDFDKLCENIEKSQEWAALITLMKREWFSRRWVVQEIALSRRGTVHCGDEEIDWQAFADAVSLFVEVESATHRLSDVMKMNAEFHHIPNFFGDVSSLGAALLVEATSNLFRKSSETGSKEPLSSLEYLVSRLSAFESTRPHDTIYALLAIAKDTTPGKKGSEGHDENLEGMPRNMKYVVTQWGREKASKQEYNVDYKLPAEDVYKEFIEFAIGKAPGTRALDIICRPWAPPVYEEGEPTIIEDAGLLWMSPARRYAQRVRTAKQLPSWIPSIEGAAFKMGEHPTAGWKMNRRNADALVGLADGTTGQRNYFAAGTRRFDPKKLRFKKGKGFHAMFVEGFIIDKIATKHEKAAGGEIPKNWPRREHWEPVESEPPEEFWRTLVADRGPNGRNPPTFYQRACKEAITRIVKHGIKTKELIDEGRCTIISQFLRRVQEVVWDRCLMRTEDGRLGLIHEEAQEGFEICILYGCSVPVVLQRCVKQPEEISVEKDEDKRQDEFRKKQKAAKLYKDALVRKKKIEEAKARSEKPSQDSQRRRLWPILNPTDLEKKLHIAGVICIGLMVWYITDHYFSAYWQEITLLMVKSTLVFHGALFLVAANVSTLFGSRLLTRLLQYPKLFTVAEAVTLHILLENHIAAMHLFRDLNHSNHLRDNRPSSSTNQVDRVIIGGLFLIGTVLLYHEKLRLSIPKLCRSLISLLTPEASQMGEISSAPNLELPLTEYWKFVGECYVFGLMNGEAISLQNEKNIERQTFELR